MGVLVGIMVVIVIGLVAVSAYLLGQQNNKQSNDVTVKRENSQNKKMVACPMDAKVCPDGSSVGRSGANCEFEACPNSSPDKGNNTKNVTENNINNSKKNGSKIESVDALWNRYTNYDLGFTIKFPKKTNLGGVSYAPEIIEDDGIVYITSSKNQRKEVIKATKSNESIFEKSSGISFAILVQKVSGKDQLDKFIKNRYDKTCHFDGLKKTKEKGVFEVLFSGDADGGDNFGPPMNCFINYATVIKYSPAKGLVATWDIGQAVNFDNKDILKKYPKGTGLDALISDSFEFLK